MGQTIAMCLQNVSSRARLGRKGGCSRGQGRGLEAAVSGGDPAASRGGSPLGHRGQHGDQVRRSSARGGPTSRQRA